MPRVNANRAYNPFPWLSEKSRMAYEWGKESFSGAWGQYRDLASFGALRRSLGDIGRGFRTMSAAGGHSIFGNEGLARQTIMAAKGQFGAGFRRLGSWATGAGYGLSGWQRAGAAAARLGTVGLLGSAAAGAIGLGAWGINRLRRR